MSPSPLQNILFLLYERPFDKKLLKKLKGALVSFIRLDTIDRLEHHDLMAKQVISILKELRDSDPESAQLLGKYMEGLAAILMRGVNPYLAKDSNDMWMRRGMQQGIEQGTTAGL